MCYVEAMEHTTDAIIRILGDVEPELVAEMKSAHVTIHKTKGKALLSVSGKADIQNGWKEKIIRSLTSGRIEWLMVVLPELAVSYSGLFQFNLIDTGPKGTLGVKSFSRATKLMMPA
jgi:hypothetical protein